MKIRTIDEVKGFCGWKFLESFINVFNFPPFQGFVSTLFETGGRVSEVLELSRENFNLEAHKDLIVVEYMPIFKRYRVIGRRQDETKKRGFKFITEKVEDYRTFPIRKDEPLVHYMLKWLNTVKSGKLFEFDRFMALKLLREAGKKLNKPIPGTMHRVEKRPLLSSEIFNHLFRAERACQLASEYGFDVYSLNQFFGWKPRKLQMAEKYASLNWKGLARRMGVSVE